ncbi:MAG: three-Cys-motif partner protein TcmP [Bacilli bacterium]
MAEKDRKQFFNQLEEHSEIKLKVLMEYVKMWMRKVVLNRYNNNHSCLIVDTFAGVGKYSDGSFGSPLLLINEAINFIEQAEGNAKMPIGSINLIFIEANVNNFKQLKQNIEDLVGQELKEDIFNRIDTHGKLRIAISNDTHEDFVTNLILSIENIIPTFLFIDPFGFKLPFALNENLLMKYDNVELLINFMYEEVGRFIEVESVEESMKTLFGVEDLSYILNQVNGTSGATRRETITNFYKDRLLEVGANHTLNFDIQKANGRFKMCLIYATKNVHGFDAMKSVLNRMSSDETTDFVYSVDKNKEQLKLMLYPKDEIIINELSEYIYDNFRGEDICSADLKTEIMKHDYIPSSYYTNAMKKLNREGKIEKVYRNVDEKVRANSFPPDSFVRFVDEIEVEL